MSVVSRAELFAQDTLKTDSRLIKEKLGESRVVVGISDDLAHTRLGQIGLLTAANILCRLGPLAPHIDFDVPGRTTVLAGVPLLSKGRSLGAELLGLGRRLATAQAGSPRRNFVDHATSYDCGLFVGAVTAKALRPVTIGADRWLGAVRADGNSERLNTGDPNPLGIVLSAALGSAEIVKRLWQPIAAPSIRIEPIDERVLLSAYDLSVNSPCPVNPDMPDRCCLGHACLMGLGATGSGCLFVLACLQGAQMSLDLVDPERIEPVNEERLFTSADPAADIGQNKAMHAHQFITKNLEHVTAFAYPCRFQQFVDQARDRLGHVLCGLDNPLARCELQTELATVVANGGTDGSGWMFSWHDFEQPDRACLIDLYRRPDQAHSDVEPELAAVLELTIPQVRSLIAGELPVDAQRVRRAMIRERDPRHRRALAALLTGNPHQAVAHLCSTMKPREQLPAATISFVSLMPAIAMAADLVKRRAYGWRPSPDDPNVFQSDALRLPTRGRGLRLLAGRHCECQKELFRRAFAERHRLREPYLRKVFAEAVLVPLTRTAEVAIAPGAPPAPVEPPPQPPPEPPPRPALTGWRGGLCRVAAFLLWLSVLVMVMGFCAGFTWTMARFIQSETRERGFALPWELIGAAWRTKLGVAQWSVYTGILVGTIVAYLLLVPLILTTAENALYAWRRTMTRPGRIHAWDLPWLRVCLCLCGGSCIELAAMPWAVIAVRYLGRACADGCCLLVAVLPYGVCLLVVMLIQLGRLPGAYHSAFGR